MTRKNFCKLLHTLDVNIQGAKLNTLINNYIDPLNPKAINLPSFKNDYKKFGKLITTLYIYI
jgi:hypothetical protein